MSEPPRICQGVFVIANVCRLDCKRVHEIDRSLQIYTFCSGTWRRRRQRWLVKTQPALRPITRSGRITA